MFSLLLCTGVATGAAEAQEEVGVGTPLEVEAMV